MAKSCKTGKCKTTVCDEAPSKAQAIISPAPTLTATVPVSSNQPADGTMITNPAEAIAAHAVDFTDMHARYVSLRALARPLQGLSQADKLPPSIAIKNIQILYALDGVDSEANISTVNFIGDISNLIAAELRRLVESIHNELITLEQVTTAMKSAVDSARLRPQPNSQPTLSVPLTSPITLQTTLPK
jgi:hypothetical protein